MKFDIKGLIVPPFTPMNSDGSINLEKIEEYVNYLHREGCNSVFVSGTTGEGLSLTLDERKRIAEEWMKHGRNKFDHIIIQVGCVNLPETQELAKHAAHIKADAIGLLPPTYFRPSSVKILGDYIAEVAKVVPELPVLYYHIPDMTAVNFQMLDVLDEVAERIPNFAGMKFSDLDLGDFGRCQSKYGDKLAMCYGKDQQILFATMLGSNAYVGSTFNYMAKLHLQMLNLYRTNDVAGATQEQIRIQKIMWHVFGKKYHGGVHKAIMSRLSGIELGPARLPFPETDSSEVDRILKELKQLGLTCQ